ncbi:peptidase S9 [Rheinheimera sp. SA_1]|uniref:S9 family peptidase n=1 Tax=Rheinheimera sp. SA_1 TaxID=1827365 RepID=UPI00080120A5|nr:prolyl oligopeptidase family serine peptidase [Rheinheimera sp. SA_1]OBP14567.1 peptidase S9 [Rheinheimera sp. SA_1]
MTQFSKPLLAVTLSAILLAGASFSTQAKEPQSYQLNPVQIQAATNGNKPMTMEQAMAHPDWLGRQPEAAYWSADSQSIYYQRKQQGAELRDWFARPLVATDNGQQVALNELDNIGAADQRFSNDGKFVAWTFEGQVFVKEVVSGKISQLTRNRQQQMDVMFLTDGRLSWRQDWDFYGLNLQSGELSLLASLKAEAEPKAPAIPDSYLAKEQHKLIQFIALEHKNATDAFNQQQLIQQQSDVLAPAPVYLGKDVSIDSASLSPKGDKILVALAGKNERNSKDIMPNYITATGDIAAQPVRARVHDQKPQPHKLVLVDVLHNKQFPLSYESLPGFDEDVLASVKAENAKRQGKSYSSKKAARDISLLNDWSWDQSAMRWDQSGSQVAVMLKAWDNKDRWLATVDFESNKLVNQHRLHDDAWINYDFNNFGWYNQGANLYFLSEESGYSHLYVKALNGKAKKLTSGTFEVSQPKLNRAGTAIYYRANPTHPGIYNVYKLDLAAEKIQQLTALTGNLSFDLSPDESQLLVRYSTSVMPEELYVMANQSGSVLKRLTYTVSEQLTAMALQAPKVIAVPSSHGEQPVFAKLYLPKDYLQGEKRRAVIFNHGAGYLQNSDLGWSNYFREFFFHQILTQQGYVVLDMDYRASKGYGRDWRTAIYRQMGTPETQDLMDGVKWLVDNTNVDVARVGTYGGSYGGFMTFMAMFTQPDLFKAGSALRPVGDWAYYNQPYTSNILNTPDVDPIAYERSSPIYFTEGLKNQLLINAPMVDDNVFFQDTVRVVQRLIEQEKNTFETAIFPVEPHGFRQPSSWLDEYRRIYKLFEREL